MFQQRPKRILFRIIIPFTLLFAITTTFSWIFSAWLITRYLDRELQTQMERVAEVISTSTFVLNPAILQQLKAVINTDIVFSSPDGTILNSTIRNNKISKILLEMMPAYIEKPLNSFKAKLDNEGYRVIIRPIDLPESGHAYLSLWKPSRDAELLKSEIIFAMGGVAICGILIMAAAGFIIAGTITAPVKRLVNATVTAFDGKSIERVQVDTRDEIGILADSFNQMIDRIKDSEKKLIESEKLATAGRMAAGFAHEIRNPLTSIKMMGQVLHGRLKGQNDKQEIISQFIKEINRLDRIIQEMIDRARPSELDKKLSKINVQVEEVAVIARQGLSVQNVNLRLNLEDKLPDIIMDPEKIKQVLWNLILNARDAMPRGGLLEIATGFSDIGSIEITVRDSGHGIQEDNLVRLFQPFFTTKPEGVGLGLTMSMKIIEQHGGKLNLKNRTDGRGVEASFYLPIS